MKQTAVEWLENQIKNSKYYFKLMAEINSRSTIAQPNVFEQAKEMEKNQMIDFAENYEMWESENYPRKTFEQYYNETFK
jgi:hypothetical protein